MRIRHESLAAAKRASRNVEANRATLREAGGTAAKGRASEVLSAKDDGGRPSSSSASGEGGKGGPEHEGGGGGGGGDGGSALEGLVAAEKLGRVQGNAGAEEWLKEVTLFFGGQSFADVCGLRKARTASVL